MLIKPRHSALLHAISLGKNQGNEHKHTHTHTNTPTHSIPFDYSLLLFQIYSALCCIRCPFCLSEMMERSSLICLAVTTAKSKLLSLRWFLQLAHYKLRCSCNIFCESLFLSCKVFLVIKLVL